MGWRIPSRYPALTAARIVLSALAALFVLATALPLIRKPYWWVRSFDFPRAQLTVGALATFAALAGVLVATVSQSGGAAVSGASWGLLGLLAVSVVYQISRMLPYTRLRSPRSLPADVVVEGRSLRLVISNVLMTNRDSERWLRVVQAEDPDVVVAVETDGWWAEATGVLKETHPHAIQLPQDDTYGMCVYSRFPLERVEVRHLVEPEVPSLFLSARLPGGDLVRFVFLHPRPPRPDTRQGSQLRDAELVLAAREVTTYERPVVVAGDLNDVAWSFTTDLFQKLSGLLDPRIGRGFFATFHADHWWLRYPLDHVFHSDDLALVELRRLDHVGSDHFPMLIELAVDPSKRALQHAPEADESDEAAAEDAVEEMAAFKAEESPEERAERKAEDV